VHGTFSAIAVKFAGETPRQIAAHHRIALDHQQRRRDKIRRDGTLMPRLRVRGMEHFFRARYGQDRLPDDATGRRHLRLVADHLAQINPHLIRIWAAKWAPWLTADDLDELIARVGIGKRWKADPLARELGLTDAERTATKNWTIGAVDCTKAQRAARRKRKRAAACRAARAAAGATPRSQSITATKPWIADGFNTRRTWERNGKKPRVANSRPVPLVSSPDTNLRPLQKKESVGEGIRVEAHTKTPVTTKPEGTHCGKPTTSTGRLPFSRIDGDGARDEAQMIPLTEFARLRLVALSKKAVESECPAPWSDVREAAAEWQDAKREVAAGETTFVAVPEGAPASEWHPTRATVVVAMTWRRSFPCRLAA
jgi:hypothetical protein